MQNERRRVEDNGEERAMKEQSGEKKEKTFDDQSALSRHSYTEKNKNQDFRAHH